MIIKDQLLNRALKIRERALPADHPDIAISLNNLVALYRKQGRYSEAEPLMRRALTIMQSSLGAEHPNTKTVSANYQHLLTEINQR